MAEEEAKESAAKRAMKTKLAVAAAAAALGAYFSREEIAAMRLELDRATFEGLVTWLREERGVALAAGVGVFPLCGILVARGPA